MNEKLKGILLNLPLKPPCDIDTSRDCPDEYGGCYSSRYYALCPQMVSVLQTQIEAAGLIMPENHPKIICLCGSSRFINHFAVMAWEFEKLGCICLGLHLLPDNYKTLVPDHLAEAEGVATMLDELHKRKIDLADEVFVLNVGGYIGDSTRSEIEYARAHNKPIKWLEPERAAFELRDKDTREEYLNKTLGDVFRDDNPFPRLRDEMY
jgi:hypothetical protein